MRAWADSAPQEHVGDQDDETARSTDLDDEKQVVMDRPTVAYRRWMSSLGSWSI
jgi:hypothetical protein